MKLMNILVGLVDPQPEYIESSGRWKWPLKPEHSNEGRCPAVYTASREWWEYVPVDALPSPDCWAQQMEDGKWIWLRPPESEEA